MPYYTRTAGEPRKGVGFYPDQQFLAVSAVTVTRPLDTSPPIHLNATSSLPGLTSVGSLPARKEYRLQELAVN